MQAAAQGHVEVCAALMTYCVNRMGFGPGSKLAAPKLEIGGRLAEPEPLNSAMQSRVDDALAKVRVNRISMSGATSPAAVPVSHYHRSSSDGRAMAITPPPRLSIPVSVLATKPRDLLVRQCPHVLMTRNRYSTGST